MAKRSAGLLMYRLNPEFQCFLVHPGGPYYKNRNQGFWTIPKGLIELNESELDAAQREFHEETGIQAQGPFLELGEIRYKKGKIVLAWAFEGEWEEVQGITSNNFSMEWPPHSGKEESFPEIDMAAWYNKESAFEYIHPAQQDFILRLISILHPDLSS